MHDCRKAKCWRLSLELIAFSIFKTATVADHLAKTATFLAVRTIVKEDHQTIQIHIMVFALEASQGPRQRASATHGCACCTLILGRDLSLGTNCTLIH